MSHKYATFSAQQLISLANRLHLLSNLPYRLILTKLSLKSTILHRLQFAHSTLLHCTLWLRLAAIQSGAQWRRHLHAAHLPVQLSECNQLQPAWQTPVGFH